MIIVEGYDHSGKTTLAKMIAGGFGYTYIHSPGVVKSDETLKERLYWYDCLTRIKNVVLDRCYYISEIVYGEIIRGSSKISYTELMSYLNKLRCHKNLLIFCNQDLKAEYNGPTEAIHLTARDRRHLERNVKEKHDKIKESYEILFYSCISKHLYEYLEVKSIADYDGVFDHIKRYYERSIL